MKRLLGVCIASGLAAAAAPAYADGVADAKALIAKYSKLPSFEAPGPAFDAAACMKGKKIFAIPLTDDNPFEVAIVGGMAQAAKMVGFDFRAWQTQLSPDQWTQGINKAVEEKYNLIDLVGGLPPEYIAPQIGEARTKGVKVVTTHDYDFTQTPPDFLDGSAKTDYVTVGKLIAAWAIAKTDGKVDAVVLGPDEITPTGPLEESGARLFQGKLPVLQDDLHQHARGGMGDQDSAGGSGGPAGRSRDQLRAADLRLDGAIRSAGDRRDQLQGEDRLV